MRVLNRSTISRWFQVSAVAALMMLPGMHNAAADPASACQRLVPTALAISAEAEKNGCDFDFTSPMWDIATLYPSCINLFQAFPSTITGEGIAAAQWNAEHTQRIGLFQQCLAKKQAAATPPVDNAPMTPLPADPPAGGAMTASTCGLPGGTATVVIKDPNITRLNVRDRPSGNIIGSVPEGSQVNVLGACGIRLQAGIVANPGGNKPPVPGWCAIAEPVGCVAEQFLVPGVVPVAQGGQGGQVGQGGQPQAPVVVVNVPQGNQTGATSAVLRKGANVRSEPSSKAGQRTVLFSLSKGTEVTVLGCERSWCRIAHPQHPAAWVARDFLVFDGPVGQGAPVEITVNVDPGQAPGGAGGPGPAAGLVANTPVAQSSFSGRWNATAQGSAYTMQLNQVGRAVTGSYAGGDGSNGQIEGSVSGNVLRFRWQQADGLSGAGKFALSPDGGAFSGSFALGGDPDVVDGAWDGTRQ